jgi:quaternary ammonium compound-resistance protein SugE
MAWACLIVAGLLEVAWAFLMKQSEGFTRPWPSIGALAFMGASFALLAYAMRTLPLGTAYVVWTGIGAVGAFLVGMTLLGEPASPLRIAAAVLIVSGLVLMKLTSGGPPARSPQSARLAFTESMPAVRAEPRPKR